VRILKKAFTPAGIRVETLSLFGGLERRRLRFWSPSRAASARLARQTQMNTPIPARSSPPSRGETGPRQGARADFEIWQRPRRGGKSSLAAQARDCRPRAKLSPVMAILEARPATHRMPAGSERGDDISRFCGRKRRGSGSSASPTGPQPTTAPEEQQAFEERRVILPVTLSVRLASRPLVPPLS